ncbi:AAA family ATPase [Salinimonas marina]|uniref:AAA family ATPase n=1 Tax=Salinimonas marina TaxID=2785918 RepID=A0A7S9E099_9ALTE|nr:AAA family ATPase [Salinimonas marina]QPG06948.1 AAA family ATPase [Salinimonas marina]
MFKHEKELKKVFEVFKGSEGNIRPHFILTGPSGSGKTYTVAKLCEDLQLNHLEINAAQLTKEGTSGNSLSKALAPLGDMPADKPTVCFVDEFDKLFISGNQNSDLAHETTNGVQNEFLKVLESETAAVYGPYAKYVNIPINHVLFIFAGAFNGEEGIDLDRLRELGMKTEFLGRVGLVFNTDKVPLESLLKAMRKSELMRMYLALFPKVKRQDVEAKVTEQMTEAYANNTLGFRAISTLLHRYFICGGTNQPKQEKPLFNTALELG